MATICMRLNEHYLHYRIHHHLYTLPGGDRNQAKIISTIAVALCKIAVEVDNNTKNGRDREKSEHTRRERIGKHEI